MESQKKDSTVPHLLRIPKQAPSVQFISANCYNASDPSVFVLSPSWYNVFNPMPRPCFQIVF